MARIVLAQFETDQEGGPLTWLVYANEQQEAAIEKLFNDTVEDWQNAWVGEAKVYDFDAFLTEFREDWGNDAD